MLRGIKRRERMKCTNGLDSTPLIDAIVRSHLILAQTRHERQLKLVTTGHTLEKGCRQANSMLSSSASSIEQRPTSTRLPIRHT